MAYRYEVILLTSNTRTLKVTLRAWYDKVLCQWHAHAIENAILKYPNSTPILMVKRLNNILKKS